MKRISKKCYWIAWRSKTPTNETVSNYPKKNSSKLIPCFLFFLIILSIFWNEKYFKYRDKLRFMNFIKFPFMKEKYLALL